MPFLAPIKKLVLIMIGYWRILTWQERLLIFAVLLYVFFPYDLIPDSSHGGYIDDGTVIFLLGLFLRVSIVFYIRTRRAQRSPERARTLGQSTSPDSPTRRQHRESRPDSSTPGGKTPHEFSPRQEHFDECAICMDPAHPVTRMLKPCNHVFCCDCTSQITQRMDCCPVCRVAFTRVDVVRYPSLPQGAPIPASG